MNLVLNAGLVRNDDAIVGGAPSQWVAGWPKNKKHGHPHAGNDGNAKEMLLVYIPKFFKWVLSFKTKHTENTVC